MQHLPSALDAGSIRRDAATLAGTDVWDDEDLVEPLEVFIDSLASEARLSEAGQASTGERLRNLVAANIAVQRDARTHPELVGQDVVAPIVIFGLPRCGTTLLYGLLSADPRLRAPAFWEALRPSPPPEVETYGTDPRRAEVQRTFDEMIERSPSLLASLPYSADLNAECNTLTQSSLRTVTFIAHYRVPSYQSWYLGADPTPMLSYHRRMLQQLQWRGPSGRWALKSPPHLLNLDALVEAYPDVVLVQNHRDPRSVMSSCCALWLANHLVYSDEPDLAGIGTGVLDLWGTGCDRTEAYRARPDARPVFDVDYDELVADPLATVERVYDAVAMELTSSVRSAMERWLVDNARDKRPVERHDLAEFGQAADDLCVVEPTSDDPFYGENHALWLWDEEHRLGVHLYLKTLGHISSFHHRRETIYVTLPDGTVLTSDQDGPGPVDPRVPRGANLVGECVEPFRHWTFRYDCTARPTTAAEMRVGLLSTFPPSRLTFDLAIETVAPPWLLGTYSEGEHVEWAQQFFGGRRYEQLVQATGTVQTADGSWRLDAVGMRTHRVGHRDVGAFPGHTWSTGFFPDGRSFGVHKFCGADGVAQWQEAWVALPDGVRHPARIITTPLFSQCLPGEALPIEFESDLGRTMINGTLRATNFVTAKQPDTQKFCPGVDRGDPGHRILSQGLAAYEWDGVRGGGMIERSMRVAQIGPVPVD